MWAFAASVAAALLALGAALAGRWAIAAASAALSVLAWYAARRANHADPIAMPFLMRAVLYLPRGSTSPTNLERILRPRMGERILEIGPGVGVHALPVARLVAPGGSLVALDLQGAMLVTLRRRAPRAGVESVAPVTGDARSLPFASGAFDAAYLIGTLGEVPDEIGALREIRRVLKPTGRLVVGESLPDPDFVARKTLEGIARAAGFTPERATGRAVNYFALFHPEMISNEPPREQAIPVASR